MKYLSYTADEIDEKLKRIPFVVESDLNIEGIRELQEAWMEDIADQEYDSESGFAQSGKAVAQAVTAAMSEVDSKLESITVTVEIDQAYNKASENAQSGKAVEQAISNLREEIPEIKVITDDAIDALFLEDEE